MLPILAEKMASLFGFLLAVREIVVSKEFRGYLKDKLVLKELMRVITPLSNTLDLRPVVVVVVVEVEA